MMKPGFPRYFKIAGRWVNAYKVFLCVGIYTGTLVASAVAEQSGVSPLRMGLACVAIGIVGMVGARVLFLVTSAPDFGKGRFWAEAWNPKSGGMSVFGGLIVVPFSIILAHWLAIPFPALWDYLIFGIMAGGAWIRFGCIWNGCCVGRTTTGWFGLRQHDVVGVVQKRIPVQWLEILWWLLGLLGLFCLWSFSLPKGSYALAGLGWYGLGRFFLEPLRETSDLIAGRVRLHQVVAGLLALGCVFMFIANISN
jgi:prolipoprotein diacylglyceryltransferase